MHLINANNTRQKKPCNAQVKSEQKTKHIYKYFWNKSKSNSKEDPKQSFVKKGK